MIKYRINIFLSLYLVVVFAISCIPSVTLAQSANPLVPCGTKDLNGDGMIRDIKARPASAGVSAVTGVVEECNFGDFLILIKNITNYLIMLGAAVSALAFGWAGFMMMTAGGEMSKIEHAKAIFSKVLIGFLLMLSAWLIVYAIEKGLIADDSGITSLLEE